MRKRSISLMSGVILLSAVTLSFAADNGGAAGDPTAKLFEAKCAACHAKDGKGKASMAKILKLDKPELLDLSRTDVFKQTDEALAAAVSKGKGKMPAQSAKFTPEQISALVKYARTLVNSK